MIPKEMKLEVSVTIDPDIWAEIKDEGWSDTAIEKAIADSITIRDTISGALSRHPGDDIDSVSIIKYVEVR